MERRCPSRLARCCWCRPARLPRRVRSCTRAQSVLVRFTPAAVELDAGCHQLRALLPRWYSKGKPGSTGCLTLAEPLSEPLSESAGPLGRGASVDRSASGEACSSEPHLRVLQFAGASIANIWSGRLESFIAHAHLLGSLHALQATWVEYMLQG